MVDTTPLSGHDAMARIGDAARRRFRAGSAAAAIAARLLSGREMTRQQLAAGAGWRGRDAPPGTVNRVLEVLESEGARFEREVVGREARFRLAAVGPRPSDSAPPAVDAEGTVVCDTLAGAGGHWVEVELGGRRWGGFLDGDADAVYGGRSPVGERATVTAVSRSAGTLAATLTLADGREIALLGVSPASR